MDPDLSALAAALDRQIRVLAPVAARLRMAVVHPPVAPPDWHGPAAVSFGELEMQLRAQLRRAADAAEAALHAGRLAAGQLALALEVQIPHD